MVCHLLYISVFTSCVLSQPVGGPGFALRWDRRKPADVVSWVWDTVPQSEGVSYEMWVKVLDPYINFQVPFSFGVFDATNLSIYSVPYEVSLYISPGFVSMWKVNKQSDCSNASAVFNTWTHFAWTHNYSSGDLKIYQNAELKCLFPGFDTVPPRNNALVSMGMEGSSLEGSSYSDHSLFDGVLDEFRIWNGVRTAVEIHDNYQHTLDLSAPENAKINTYFNFDVPSLKILDETHTFVAELGRLATYRQYIVQVTKPSGLPSAPGYVQSDCPLLGGLVVFLVTDVEFAFNVPYYGNFSGVSAVVDFSISSLNGTLSQGDGQIISTPSTLITDSTFLLKYTASPGGKQPLQILDTISYTLFGGDLVGNLTGRIQFAWGEELPLRAESLTSGENSLSFVMLGIDTIRGTRLPIEILNISLGSLYELSFDPDLLGTDVYFFANYQSAQTKIDNLTAVSTFPYIVNNGPSVVVYVPPENYFGSSVAFYYHVVGDPNILGFNVTVIHINQPPHPSPLNFTIDEFANLTTLTLASTDIDTNYASRPFYRIIDFPKFGMLVDTQTWKSVPQEDQSQVFGWAEDVVEVSSVFPVCEGEDTTNFRECGDKSYGPLQALGPYNYFPKYGDSVDGYSPQFFGDTNWIIFKISPLVLSFIEVFETVNPGGTIGVRASDHFTTVNESLTWPLLWASDIPNPILPSEPYIFSPPLCPSFFRAKFIRLDITSSRIGIGYNIDAVRITGTTGVDKGWLYSDKVSYQPAPGIHINSSSLPLDTLSFIVSDCESISSPLSVPIFRPPPKQQPSNRSLFAKFVIPLSAILSSDILPFDQLLDTSRNDLVARNVNVTGTPIIEIISVNRPIFLTKQISSSIALTLPSVLSANNVTAQFIAVDGYVSAVEMHVWVYHGVYVHRMGVSLTPHCMNVPGLFQEAEDKPCRLCQSVTVTEYTSSLTSFQRLTYDTLCPPIIDSRVGPNTRGGLALPTTLSFLVALVAVVWTIWYRESRIVFFSGLEFLISTALGYALAVLGSQLALADECYYPWILHPGLCLAFSCGLARNWRLDKIFNSKTLRTLHIKSWHLGAFVLSVFLVNIVVLGISTGISPPQRGNFGECLLSPVEEPILVAIEFLLALLGLYYAYRVRNVPSRFNESKWLSFVLINAVVLGGLAVALEVALKLQYGQALVFRFIVYAWVSFAGLCATFLPKIIAHRKHPLQRPAAVEGPHKNKKSSVLAQMSGFVKTSVDNDTELSRVENKEDVMKSEVEELKEQLRSHVEEVQRILKARAANDDKAKELEKAQMEAETSRFTVETEIEFLMKRRTS